MRDDILGMLKNAIDHGGNPQRIAQSLVNSGYPLKDVKEALDYVVSTTPQPQQQEAQQIPAPQNDVPKAIMPKPPIYNNQVMQLKPLKPLPSQKTSPTSNNKVIIMAVILIILILSLASVIIFKDSILDFLRL
jgi:hypothetical protein